MTSLAIRTLFRSPGKTLFTFLLIAVLTFSLSIQLAEYVKTSMEFKETVGMYNGTGYVEYRPATYKGSGINLPYYLQMDSRVNAVDIPGWAEFKYPPMSAETVAEVAEFPYISSIYKRYMTAGVSGDYMRMKEESTRYDYNGRIVLEGTLDQLDLQPEEWQTSTFYLRDVKVLAGDVKAEDLACVDDTVRFKAWNFQHFNQKEVPGISAQDVNRYVNQGQWRVKHVYLKNYPYGLDFQKTLKAGDRYVFVCRFERQATNRMVNGGFVQNVTAQSLELYDWVSEHVCPAVWNVTDAPEDYLELPKYAPLKELIHVTQTDLNTFDVVYADDMTAIRRIHDNTLSIREGRWLTLEDTADDARVCVIDRALARKYDLMVGDTLSLRLGHTLFEQFYSLGAIASVPERFSDEWTQAEFEIVGIYSGSTLSKDANEPNWAYSANTIFVPLSALPLTEDELAGHAFYPGELTIRVDNTWDIEPFLKKTAPKLEAMGLTLNFDDGGWMEVLGSYRDAQRIPMIRILLLAFVTATGLALSVYLFISRKKKDYAIMRALGTPKGKAGKTLLVPLLVLSMAAVVFAAGVGAIYSHVLLNMVSALPAVFCIVGELAFTLLFAGLSIWHMSGQSPLMLLQGGPKTKATAETSQENAVPVGASAPLPDTIPAVGASSVPERSSRKPHSVCFVLRYVTRHIRRQGLKSALAVLLAVLMVGVVVQFASLCATYNELRETTPITVKFVSSLSLSRLQPLEDEGLVKDLYYERTATIDCWTGTSFEPIQIVITSDVGRFVDQEYEIRFGGEYSVEELNKTDYVLPSASLMARTGLHPGDIIWFGTSDAFNSALNKYTQQYVADYCNGIRPNANEFPSYADIFALYGAALEDALDQVSARAEVIGSISMESSAYNNTMFTAGLGNQRSLVGTYQNMNLIEFGLADNGRAEEMRQKGEEMTYGRTGAFVMDSEKLESVIRTSNLLNGLFPAVVALALLIGAAMCALLVMQTGKEAAIMRAQGTTKRKTRSMLAVEQILLALFGIVLGLGIMAAVHRADFASIAAPALLFAAAYALVLIFGSYISAGIATRKNILELLQTKE